MIMRRLLSCLAFCSFLFSVLCGAAYGAEWTSIEDMGIDPWGDLEVIEIPSGPFGTAPASTYSAAGQMYTIEDDTLDIIVYASSDREYSLDVATGPTNHFTAFQYYGNAPFTVGNRSFDIKKGFTPFASGTDVNDWETYIYGYDESSYRVSFPVSYSSSKYSKITLSGSFRSYPLIINNDGSVETRVSIGDDYFDTKLMINDEPVGEFSSGQGITLKNYEIDLSEYGSITSIGIYVTLNSSASSDKQFLWSVKAESGWYVSDSLSIVEEGSSGGVDEETKGLLATIISWLQSIGSGIGNIASLISQLPSKIVTALIDGLKSLFIPSQDDFLDIKGKYETLLSDRLGFVWQAGEWLLSFFDRLLGAFESAGDYTFRFPGIAIDLPDGHFEIVPAQDVDLDNVAMDVLRPVLGTIVSLICVIAFINSAEEMVVAMVSGASYWQYLKGGGKDDN